ncbi:xanthine dehydrogenase [Prauserella marina]|uniref:XdhC Rossmann domain-containing protein n=1 Tax=Prauserella marina TaxID=530584 RepID=A0A222VSQ1_9PSEU|nr:XdhC family protein [Prauserella marina]ASR36956.1 xanthine dehydrogenase [Prauserella marina]PWV80085.1 XdhC-like protein [Prauserella marina]SDD83538.1 XdhC Rossmann domain-containing protein [Prauserella marina]
MAADTAERESAACDVAHGIVAEQPPERTLVAVFATPVAGFLLRYGADLGYHPVLVDPSGTEPAAVRDMPELDATTDVVVTDHHRAELGEVLKAALAWPARWIGVLGNPRHEGPHVAALTALGVAESDIARVHRPVGLNIGSRAPAEIAIATLAGLIAERNGRPGGFAF